MARRIHVVPYGDAWAVKQEGADRASVITDTKSEAVAAARRIARGNDEVIVHNRQGHITKGKRYSSRDEDEGGCFITTACIKYYSLPDNCYQLNTLRSFRDNYLASTDKGKGLISLYYSVAPRIVQKINQDKDKDSLYRYIFSQVNLACRYIERRKLAKAKHLYERTVRQLAKHFEVI